MRILLALLLALVLIVPSEVRAQIPLDGVTRLSPLEIAQEMRGCSPVGGLEAAPDGSSVSLLFKIRWSRQALPPVRPQRISAL
jgi:hypothetical protein